ncbi:MAG: membrane integrity-associated transporter subunit PqiC [Novosphingobium sp.]|nr:membrane integrity-associated transporter subunit PqiC [Novosphingobium sp.]
MMAAMFKAGTAIAAVLALAGCVSIGSGKVPEQLINLTPDRAAPAGEMASGTMRDALVVLDPDTSRRLDVQRVPVQVDDSSVAYLKDATWVERPARQFRRLLAETIRARGKRLVVEGDDAELSGSTTLSGRLLDMGYDARTQAVVLRFDAIYEDKDGKVRTRRFESEVVGVTAEAGPVGRALNEAANKVAAEVADWVG